jgi:hypothetical protein
LETQQSELQRAKWGALGAYGLRLDGVDEAAALLVDVPTDWPRLRLERGIGLASADADVLSDSSARLILKSGGEIVLEREPSLATIRTPSALRIAEVVHPYLAPVAAVLAYWHGRESFHGAAITVDGGAWGLLGDRGDGKSSLAAWFALNGVAVVCDDMLIVDREQAFAGPRSVDLRQDAAQELGAGEALGTVGARQRWRLALETHSAALPLNGWVFLGWDRDVAVERVTAAERLKALSHNRGVAVPPTDPALLLELASLPAWRFARPKRWSGIAESAERLLETLAADSRR